MKILILTTYNHKIIDGDLEYFSNSTGKLCIHLRKKHLVDIGNFNQLDINISTTQNILFNDKNLDFYDWIIIRSLIYKGTNNQWLAKIVSSYCLKNNINVTNGNNFEYFGSDWNKLLQMNLYSMNGIPIPKTNFGKINYQNLPMIAKPLVGTHGNGIELINDSEKVELHNNNFMKTHLFQELLPDRQDYRVIVIGGIAIGALLRKANGDQIISNISAGGEALLAELDSDMKKIAENVANLTKLDFCGVDLMKDKLGNYKVLEVNRNPEFAGFELATGINVSKKLEEFLESKV